MQWPGCRLVVCALVARNAASSQGFRNRWIVVPVFRVQAGWALVRQRIGCSEVFWVPVGLKVETRCAVSDESWFLDRVRSEERDGGRGTIGGGNFRGL